MAKYSEYVQSLRELAIWAADNQRVLPDTLSDRLDEAADIITMLQQEVDSLKERASAYREGAEFYKAAYRDEHDERIREAKQMGKQMHEALEKYISAIPIIQGVMRLVDEERDKNA